jgi:hypothetical protein
MVPQFQKFQKNYVKFELKILKKFEIWTQFRSKQLKIVRSDRVDPIESIQ